MTRRSPTPGGSLGDTPRKPHFYFFSLFVLCPEKWIVTVLAYVLGDVDCRFTVHHHGTIYVMSGLVFLCDLCELSRD